MVVIYGLSLTRWSLMDGGVTVYISYLVIIGHAHLPKPKKNFIKLQT